MERIFELVKKKLCPNSSEKILSTTLNAAETSIRLVKEFPDSVPFLGAAASSLLFVIEECKRYSRTSKAFDSKAFEELVDPLRQMNSLFEPYKNGEAELPPRVMDQVKKFDETISGIRREVEDFKSRGRFWRFFNHRKNEERVAAPLQRVTNAVNEIIRASEVKEVSRDVQVASSSSRSSVNSPSSAQDGSNGSNSSKGIISTALNAAETAIRLVKEFSDSVPFLGAAASSVLFVVEECERYSQNSRAFEELVGPLKRMNLLLDQYKNNLPPKVKEHAEEFNRTIASIRQEVEDLKSSGRISQFINSRENEEQIAAVVQRVKTAVEEIMLANLLDISSGVNEVSRDVQEIVLAQSLLALKPVDGARYNCVNRNQCLEGTRGSVLEDIQTWFSSGNQQVYWLNGAAGMGKTTIALSVAHRLVSGHETLLGTFFCSRESADRRTSGHIFPTLACQLASWNREYQNELVEVLKRYPYIGSALPDEQLLRLIVEPLRKIEPPPPVALVIDALDECDDEKATEKVLLAFLEHIHATPSLKVFVSCRPVASVERQLSSGENRRMFKLHDVETSVVGSDLRLFYNDRLAKVRAEQSLVRDWPSANAVDRLVQHAAGLFIFADTVCKYLASTSDPQGRLEHLANLPIAEYKDSLSVDMLYTEVLLTAFEKIPTVGDDPSRQNFKRVLASVMLVKEPVTVDTLGSLLSIHPSVICNLLRDIHPILSAPRDAATGKDELIHTFHASFPDYMTSLDRAGKRVPEIFILPDEQDLDLALCCLKCMNRELDFLPPYTVRRASLGSEDSIVGSQNPDAPVKNISGPLRYTCLYWTGHLSFTSAYFMITSVNVQKSVRSALLAELQEIVTTKWSFYVESLRTLGIANEYALREMVHYGESLAHLIGNTDRREFDWGTFIRMILNISRILPRG